MLSNPRMCTDPASSRKRVKSEEFIALYASVSFGQLCAPHPWWIIGDVWTSCSQ